MSCFVKHSSAIEGEETLRESLDFAEFCGERFERSVNWLSEKMEVANDGNTWWAWGKILVFV